MALAYLRARLQRHLRKQKQLQRDWVRMNQTWLDQTDQEQAEMIWSLKLKSLLVEEAKAPSTMA